MTQRHAAVYLSLAFASLSLASSCSDTEHQGGGVRGILRSGTADYFEEGRVERFYALERDDGSSVGLQFAERPGVAPGTEIVVFGLQREDGIHVDRFALAEPRGSGIGQQQQALIDPTPLTPPLRAALVSLSPTYTNDMLKTRVAADNFIKPMLEVSSYGIWTMEWEYLGPFNVARDCGGQFFSNIGTNAVAAMKAAGVDTTKYDQFQFILGSDFPCSWGGFGLDGHTPKRTDGKRGMYNPWSYVKRDSANVMVQEIGHNWGLAHSHFCPGAATPSANCSGYVEYGSSFTPMGTGNNAYLNGWERIQMNFLQGCNVITIGTSGTYEIGPLTKPCNGPQVLRVAADKAGDVQRYFYIEYRTPVGIEKTDGLLVHYTADIKNGGWVRCDWGGPDCPEDWLVNVKGGAAADALITEGVEWTTPQNVKIKVASVSGGTAKLELTFATPGGANTCMDDVPFEAKAPTCGPGGTTTTGAGGAGGAGVGGAGGGSAGGRGGAGGMGTGGAAGSGGVTGSGGAGGDATTGSGGNGTGTAGATGVTAGTTGSTGGGGTSGVGGAAGGVPPGGGMTPPGTDTGCGCRLPSTRSSNALPIALAATLVGLVRRRRRRAEAQRTASTSVE
jgi:hypothetical protein